MLTVLLVAFTPDFFIEVESDVVMLSEVKLAPGGIMSLEIRN